MLSRLARIEWITWHPNPYNNFLFEQLARGLELPLTVHFMRPGLPSHPWQSQMPACFENRTFQLTHLFDWHSIATAALRKDRLFVIAGWNEPTALTILTLSAALRKRYVIWSDTPNLQRSGNAIKEKLRARYLRWIFKNASYVMSTGRPGTAALAEMGCPQDKIVNFPCFVDIDLYRRPSPNSYRPQSEQLKFLSVGRLVRNDKAFDLAIDAIEQATRASKFDNFEYYIAGTGPDLDYLRQHVRRRGLERHVTFLGWVEPLRLRDYFCRCHVLLHPSLYEPFGNVVLEGMAASMVVLGSDACGAVLDRINSGVNGFVHCKGDVDALTAQISFILQNPDCIQRIGAAARSTAEQYPGSVAVSTINRLVERVTQVPAPQ